MNNYPLVCVCIPAYNTGKYLRRCMESVINQTYENIMIVCVDDGSTDNSPDILEEYNRNYENVEFIKHKENMGLAITRNTSIDYVINNHADAKYIMFVDSDDFLPSSSVSNLVYISESNNVDVVLADLTYVNGNEEVYPSNDDSYCVNIKNKDDVIPDILVDKIESQMGGKFFRLGCVRDVRFPQARYYAQDMMVSYLFVNNADSIAITNLICYYYFGTRQDNTTNTPKNFIKGSLDRSIAFWGRYEFCKEKNIATGVADCVLLRAVEFGGGALRLLKKNTYGHEDAVPVRKFIKRYKHDIFLNNRIPFIKRLAAILLAYVK